jgi:hypothetical protein
VKHQPRKRSDCWSSSVLAGFYSTENSEEPDFFVMGSL